LGGILASEEQSRTREPWSEEKDFPENNIFIRNYACEYGDVIETGSELGFA
jgi:hypothetical protein